VLAKALWDPVAEYQVNDDACPELHEFYRLVGEFFQHQDWASVHGLMKYLLARPDRDEFDWLFIGYNSMKVAYQRNPLPDLTAEERELITTRKLWDFMEGRPDARQVVGRLIEQITEKLERSVAKER
jgi:hypothetical protein